MPDYLLLVRRGGYAALWIELKRPAKDGKLKGRVSADQEEWLLQAEKCGHKAVVCFGYKDAINEICMYLEKDKSHAIEEGKLKQSSPRKY